MIVGIGLDLVDVVTITLALRRDIACASAWCTEHEVEVLGDRAKDAKTLAGRVAAKEAVTKALGTGFAGEVAWQDVELLPEPTGAISVWLTGEAKRVADSMGVVRLLVSITHTSSTAGACAVAVGRGGA